VVLLSAGIGATPVLAMLYALAAARSARQVLCSTGLPIGSIIHSPPRSVESAMVPATSAIRAAPKWQTSISYTIPDDVAIVRCCILRTPH